MGCRRMAVVAAFDRVIVTLIPNSAGEPGLRVRAELDQGCYPSGTKVTN